MFEKRSHETITNSLGNLSHTEDTINLGNTEKKSFVSIKRYTPRYKKLICFRQPLWPEKYKKTRKFKRQRWKFIRKVYRAKRFKYFRQDLSTYSLSPFFKEDRIVRVKKTFKFLLRDKQRLQIYYGYGRLRFYQLKTSTRNALKFSKNKKLLPATVFFHIMESQLHNVIYRNCFSSSLMQAKRLISCGHLKVENIIIKTSTYRLKSFELVKIDPAIFHMVSITHLKYALPYFYFKYKTFCCDSIGDSKFLLNNGFIHLTLDFTLSYLNRYLKKIQFYKLRKKKTY